MESIITFLIREVYEAERSWVLMMDRYLKNCREKLRTEESMNEGDFEIWGREKFLKEEQGKDGVQAHGNIHGNAEYL